MPKKHKKQNKKKLSKRVSKRVSKAAGKKIGKLINRFLYYDKKTNKRVNKTTWKRSRAHGGTRYVRKAISVRKPKTSVRRLRSAKLPAVFPKKGRPQSFLVTSRNDSAKKSFDFDTIAESRENAIRYTQAELEERHGKFSPRALTKNFSWRWSAIPFHPPEYHNEDKLGEVEDR